MEICNFEIAKKLKEKGFTQDFNIFGCKFVFSDENTMFILNAGFCVGLAMCFAMTISGFTGAAIPICLYRFGIDPAVASGPLITTINDLVAVISYYGLAWVLLLSI